MISFFSAFATFLALHSIPALPSIRAGIIGSLGRPAYFVCYSAASIAALVWLFSAALSLDYIPLWDLQPWQAAVTFVLAPFGGFLVIAGLLSRNPLSISIRSSGEVGAVARITRHPVLWGFAIWAAGHIVANGDLRSLLLFGGFALFALAAIPMTEKRAQRRLGERWSALSQRTGIVPFGALARGQGISVDGAMIVAFAVTAALGRWLLLGGGHAVLFGADPIAIFG